jgi:hypothetical protein
MLIVAGLAATVPMRARAQLFFGPAKMPAKWDARIPVPPKATMLSETPPHAGSDVYSAEFLAPRSYDDTVAFYEAELPKAGFKMGPKTANSQRKLYRRTFTDGTVRDKLNIHTRPGDNRGLITIHIDYTLPPGGGSGSH